MNIISQRPVEISETVIAQTSNFLIFKMTHPKDIEYIRTMLPNISADVIEKQKVLQPGNCVGFGGAFKLPMVIKMEMPNPAPNSNSCDVNRCWMVQGTNIATAESTTAPNGNAQAGTTPSAAVAAAPKPAFGVPTPTGNGGGQPVNPALVGLGGNTATSGNLT